MGKLGGHKYTWRPWFNAQKLSFKLTENLEMGFTRWSILWGVGHPITVAQLHSEFHLHQQPERCLWRRRHRPRATARAVSISATASPACATG